MPSIMQEKYVHKPCTQCSDGKLLEPINGQEWYLECGECKAIHLVYDPLPHQKAFHADAAKIKMFAGGYG